MRHRFSVVGSVVADIIIHTTKEFKLIKDRLSFPFDSKISIKKIRFDIGGSAHNLSTNLSNLGNEVHLFSKIGKDSNGDLILKSLKRFKVKLKNVKRIEEDLSGFSLVFLYNHEKSIIVYRGANNLIGKEDVDEKTIKKSEWFIFTSLISDKNIEFLKGALKIAKENGVKILSNPSSSMINYRKKELLSFISSSDLLILNNKEALKLSNTTKVDRAINVLRKKVEKGIVTLGSKGCIVWEGKKTKRVKAYKVKVADTTGAGDSFSAGVIHAFSRGLKLEKAAKFGSAVSALVIQVEGATTWLPKEHDVIEFLRKRGENFV